MTKCPLFHALRLASLLAVVWTCAPAMADVRNGAAPMSLGEALPRRADVPAGIEPAAGPPPVRMAGGDCSGAAAQAASQSGGQVLSVSSSQQGGRTVCVVTVLVPGTDGGRPRKKTIAIPQ